MTFYQVTHEIYYDDFGGGGTSVKGLWFYASKENAIKKVAEIKPIIKEEYQSEEEYTEEYMEFINHIDTPERFEISDAGGMCYWGSAVYITEETTEDNADSNVNIQMKLKELIETWKTPYDGFTDDDGYYADGYNTAMEIVVHSLSELL